MPRLAVRPLPEGSRKMDEFFRDGPKYGAFRNYWRAYGGWRALLKSPYLGWSIIISWILFPLWWNADPRGAYPWHEHVFSILPAMTGFSLGAFAILLAFSDENFLKVAHKERKGGSYYMSVVSAFFHFILVQIAAMVIGFISIAFPVRILSYFGLLLMIYALACAMAAASAIFGAARILDLSRRKGD